MAEKIETAKLTFISVETMPAQFEQVIDPHAPLARLARGTSFIQLFDDARAGNAPLGLRPPWPDRRGQMFWTRYLERHPGTVGGRQAWNSLVPLRKAPALGVDAKQPGHRCLVEAFFFPHAIGFVLTVYIESPGTLEETVGVGYRLRHEQEFSLTLPAQPPIDCKYDQLASSALSHLRNLAFGPKAPAGEPSNDPFTVLAVIKASGFDKAEAVTADSDLHKDLDGMTRWKPFHRNVAPSDLTKSRLDIMASPVSHVLYATKRGRAIWFPNLFSSTKLSKPTISCYHRNIVLASLQVESLAGVLKVAEPLCKAGAALPQHLRECANKATALLTLFYLGKPSTYRSASIQSQIDSNGLVSVIDECRSYFHMSPPLSPPPPAPPPAQPSQPTSP